MENVIDKETEKEVVALVEKYNKAWQQEDAEDAKDTESDKLFAKACDLLYEKLKNKRFVVEETYSIDDVDVEGIIHTFADNIFEDNTFKNLNKVIHDELYGWYNEKDPLSADYKIV